MSDRKGSEQRPDVLLSRLLKTPPKPCPKREHGKGTPAASKGRAEKPKADPAA
jgi:hypothetical protein